MKISLINPPFDIIQQAYGSARGGIKYGYWAPFGVAVLAGAAKKVGAEMDYIDSSTMGFNHDDVVREVEKSAPEVIGISAQLASRQSVELLIKKLREKTKSPIFLGGILATTFGESMLHENPGLDYAVIGEAEQTLQELLLKLKNHQDIKTVRGICYRDEGKIVRTDTRPVLMNMDLLPPPGFRNLRF